MAQDPATRTDLELAFEVDELPLRALVAAGGAFNGLLREVAREYVGTRQDPAQWLVHIEPGCVLLPVRAEPAIDDVSPSRLREVAAVVAEGLATIEDAAVRPSYFTDRALEQARELAKLAAPEMPIAVRNGRARTSLTARLVANVEEVLGEDEQTIGTVEGKLEALNVHGQSNRFSVYDALTGSKVECNLTSRVTVEDLRLAIGRRVSVRGPVRSRPGGRVVSVQAEELHILPAEEDLPSPEDVFGILSGYEVDEG